MKTEDLRYPIGQFEAPAAVTPAQVSAWIDEIENFPAALRVVIEPMTPEQLDTLYRPGGWRVRQVVHHVADSHQSSYIRFKWALTEDRPTIKAYYEDRWAKLHDYVGMPIAMSLRFLDVLHERWGYLLRGLSAGDLQREFIHPESGVIRLDTNIGIYAWHGRHHLAHITHLVAREGWTC